LNKGKLFHDEKKEKVAWKNEKRQRRATADQGGIRADSVSGRQADLQRERLMFIAAWVQTASD
jgi:hypothetical protein